MPGSVGASDLPELNEALLHEVYSESNLALGFIESGLVEYDDNTKLLVTDFCAAFSVWYAQERGEDRRIPSNESISRALRSLGDPRIILGDAMRSDGKRYIGGLKLTEEGLDFWAGVAMGKMMEPKQAGLSQSQSEVNKPWKRVRFNRHSDAG